MIDKRQIYFEYFYILGIDDDYKYLRKGNKLLDILIIKGRNGLYLLEKLDIIVNFIKGKEEYFEFYTYDKKQSLKEIIGIKQEVIDYFFTIYDIPTGKCTTS